MNTEIVIPGNKSIKGVIVDTHIDEVKEAIDHAAALHIFDEFLDGKSPNTIGSYRKSISMLEEFLASIHIEVEGLFDNPAEWAKISWGMIKGFQKHLCKVGYNSTTVNSRISACKAFSTQAHQAGFLDDTQFFKMRGIRAVPKKLDENGHPIHSGIEGAKKAEFNRISEAQLEIMKAKPSLQTPIGRRDALLCVLLADHGLRISEVRGLQVEDVDISAGLMRFWRRKVKKFSKHKMTKDTLKVMALYLQYDRKDKTGPLLVASHGTRLTNDRLSGAQAFSVTRALGKVVGIDTCSPHDLRHAWVQRCLNHNTSMEDLRKSGAWSGYSMIQLYAGENAIDNLGMKLEG
jgi:site-specific recombinase XerD